MKNSRKNTGRERTAKARLTGDKLRPASAGAVRRIARAKPDAHMDIAMRLPVSLIKYYRDVAKMAGTDPSTAINVVLAIQFLPRPPVERTEP